MLDKETQQIDDIKKEAQQQYKTTHNYRQTRRGAGDKPVSSSFPFTQSKKKKL